MAAKSLARHVPDTTLRWWYTSFSSTASMSMTACSATATELAPPLLATGTLALRAASTSTRS